MTVVGEHVEAVVEEHPPPRAVPQLEEVADALGRRQAHVLEVDVARPSRWRRARIGYAVERRRPARRSWHDATTSDHRPRRRRAEEPGDAGRARPSLQATRPSGQASASTGTSTMRRDRRCCARRGARRRRTPRPPARCGTGAGATSGEDGQRHLQRGTRARRTTVNAGRLPLDHLAQHVLALQELEREQQQLRAQRVHRAEQRSRARASAGTAAPPTRRGPGRAGARAPPPRGRRARAGTSRGCSPRASRPAGASAGRARPRRPAR